MKSHTDTSKATQRLAVLCLVSLCFAGQDAPAQKAPQPAPAKAADGGWGEVWKGLAARILSSESEEGEEFRYGDTLTFVVRARNVGGDDFACTARSMNGTITLNGDHLRYDSIPGDPILFRLGPGQSMRIHGGTIKVRLVPVGEKAPPDRAGEGATLLPLLPGKYTFVCSQPLWMSNEENPNSASTYPARPNPITFTLLPHRRMKLIRTPRPDPPQTNILWSDPVSRSRAAFPLCLRPARPIPRSSGWCSNSGFAT